MNPLGRPLQAGLIAILSMSSSLGAKEVEVFNGKDLSGWHAAEKKKKQDKEKYWKVAEAVIIGDNPDKKDSVLWTNSKFEDYELTVEFMTPSADYDSGVFLHGPSHQIQIGISRSLKTDLTACLYAPIDGKGGYPAISDQVKNVHKLGEWNTLKVVVEGKRIRTWLNGVAFIDYLATKFPASGPIGLQLHSGVHQTMHFRNLKLVAE